jgi:hypothetical protein
MSTVSRVEVAILIAYQREITAGRIVVASCVAKERRKSNAVQLRGASQPIIQCCDSRLP